MLAAARLPILDGWTRIEYLPPASLAASFHRSVQPGLRRMAKSSKDQRQFGDFQTPLSLAQAAVGALRSQNVAPRSVIEPTCGEGAFLLAAIEAFPNAERFVGLDLNAQ